MPNPVPEKRVGLALLLIGGFSLILYAINTYATKSTDMFACVVILVLLGLGWYLRQRFKSWGAPPPQGPRKPSAGPKPSGPKPPLPAPKGGGRAPSGPKPGAGPPAGAKPAPPLLPPAAAKPRGLLGQLDQAFKPRNKK